MVNGNRFTLEQLYGTYYDEDSVIECQSIKGNTFYMIGEDNPSILDAGYIILKDGKFVKIFQSQDHDSVFSYFFTLYLELPFLKEMNSGIAAQELNKLGFPVYFGIKSRYLGEMESRGFSDSYFQNYQMQSFEKPGGMFILSLPKDGPNYVLTDEQKMSIQKLLSSYEDEKMRVGFSSSLIVGNIEESSELTPMGIKRILEIQNKKHL